MKTSFYVLVATSLAMLGCSAGQPQPVHMANPASVNCVEQGGESTIVQQADGSQAGICQLPDGRLIEEWELFRQDKEARQPLGETPECMEHRAMMTAPIPPDVNERLRLACEASRLEK